MIVGIYDIARGAVIASYPSRTLRKKSIYQEPNFIAFESIEDPFSYVYDGTNMVHDSNYVSPTKIYPKIYDFVRGDVKNKDVRDINYTSELTSNLFPKRTFTQGELVKVIWYADKELTNKVIVVDISYTRDDYGFPIERTTIRTWINTDESNFIDQKITTKYYTINNLDMIVEGKRRRGNIVDGVQLPTFSFLQEAANDPVAASNYGLNPSTVLLVGREFMDRFEDDFAKFIDNSSSITDTSDPNFNRKTVVVNFEIASTTTDQWLNFQPAALGGGRILDYLVGEFSI